MPNIIKNKKYPSELGDLEVMTITKPNDLSEFLLSRKKNDRWVYAYINETSVVGIPNAPILVSSIINDTNISGEEESVIDCMQDMGLLLRFPLENKIETIPLRYTATNSVFERAGLTGRTLRNTGDGALESSEKAEWLTRALSLYSNQCKILIRDGKIATDRSSEYVVLNTDELIYTLETALKTNWPNYKMEKAEISQEYTVVCYSYNDKNAEERIKKIFKKCKLECNSVKIGVKFATSDIGNSAATLYPILQIDNRAVIQFGNILTMEHSSGACIEKWVDEILPKLTVLAQNVESTIEKLATIQIKNPGGCLRNIASLLKLPKEASISVGNEYDAVYYNECTALDIYSGLFEIIDMNEERYTKSVSGGYSPTQKIRYYEICASALSYDFKEKDIDFEWRN